jgi:hypothetical protein
LWLLLLLFIIVVVVRVWFAQLVYRRATGWTAGV